MKQRWSLLRTASWCGDGGVATCCCGGGGVVATQSIGSGVGDIAIVLDDKVDVFVS